MDKLFSKSTYGTLGILVIVSFVLSCARMSAPTGGPKDEDPPVPLSSKPANYSTNFKGNKFIVEFNEFTTLSNVRQELLVSPPVPEKPDVKQRGKSLVVKINNELKDSTTYNFNFYNAIKDLNEGNELKNFQFEFSTGPEFDSIYLGGIMHDAYDYSVDAGWYVMLYENFHDTIPRTTLPNYVAKTDKEGYFFISNLKKKPYYIFGLLDMNNNMLFDLPNERIAFIDSSFSPGFTEHTFVDTIQVIESVSDDYKDTVFVDSLLYHTEMVTTIADIRLFMFEEEFEQQFFKSLYRNEREQVIFSFNNNLKENFSIKPLLDTVYANKWFFEEALNDKDSMVYWLTDSVLYNKDSLLFEVNYTMKDSNYNDYIKTDTLIAFYADKTDDKKGGGKDGGKSKKSGRRLNLNLLGDKEEEETKEDTVIPPSKLTFSHNAKDPFELNKAVELIAKYPIAKVNENLIEFNKIDDDTLPVRFEFLQDKEELRKYYLEFDKDEEEQFQILIPAGTFTDIYGNINDTLKYKFKTRGLDYYSTITLDIIDVKQQSFVQLLNEKKEVLQEKQINSDTTLLFDYLAPAKYSFRLYYDANNNGKWDTGNYKELQQAERVFYYPFFPEPLEVKSNIDIINTWELYPKLGVSNLHPKHSGHKEGH